MTSVAPTKTASEPAARGERPRRKRRLFLRLALVALLLLFAVRATHPFWLPGLIDGAAARQGLAVAYEELEFSLLDGRLDLRRVELTPRESASQPERPGELLKLDYLGLDVDVSSLFSGELRVHRIEVDGLRADLTREANGRWNFDVQPSGTTAAPKTEPKATEELAAASEENPVEPVPLEPRPLELGLPLEIDGAVLHGLRVHLVDHAVVPAVDHTLVVDVALRDLGHDEVPASITIDAWAADLLGRAHLQATLRSGSRHLEMEGRCDLLDLELGPLTPYLAALGLAPEAKRLSFEAGFSADLDPAGAAGAAPPEEAQSPERTSELAAPQSVDLTGTVRLSSVLLSTDDQPAFAIDEIVADVRAASSSALHVSEVRLTGLTGNAARTPDGSLSAAGLRLVGAPAATEESQEPESEEPPGSPGTFDATVDRLVLEPATFTFHDAAVRPPVSLELELTGEVTSLVLDPDGAPGPAELAFVVTLPELGRFRTTGTLVPSASAPNLELDLIGEALTLDSLSPYLTPLGLAPALREGRLEVHLAAGAQLEDADAGAGHFAIGPVRLLSGEELLFGVRRIGTQGVRFTQAEGLVVDEVALDGLEVPVHVDAEGGLHLFGLRTASNGTANPEAPQAEGASARSPDTTEPSNDREPDPLELPRIRATRLALTDASFTVSAPHADPPLDLTLEGGEILLEDLVLGEPGAPPARLTAGIDGGVLFERASLTGELQNRGTGVALRGGLALTLSGLDTHVLDGLLRPLGLEGTVSAGELRGALAFELAATPSRWEGRLDVRDVRFVDGERELLALDELALTGFGLDTRVADRGAASAGIDSLSIRGPRLALARNGAGQLELLGLRLVEKSPPTSEPAPELSAPTGDALPLPAASEPSAAPTDPAPPPPTFLLERFTLEDARIAWHDAALEPALDLALELSARGERLGTDPAREPGNFGVNARIAGVAERLALELETRLDPRDLALTGRATGSAITAGPLARYLPQNVRPADERADLALELLFTSKLHPEGGRSLRARMGDLRFGPESAAWFELGEFLFDAPRLDAEHAIYEIERLALDGLGLEIRDTIAGREILGLVIAEATEVASGPVSTGAAIEANTGPATPTPAANEASPDPRVSSGPAESAPAPTVRLGQLDLGVDRLRYVDEVHGGEPLDLSLAWITEAPQILSGPVPEDLEPLRFALVAAAGGSEAALMERARIDIELSPFAAEPQLLLPITIEGLHGAELGRFLPALAERVDATRYVGGSFEAMLEASLRPRRRGPFDLGLDRPLSLQAALTGLALRTSPGADPSVSVERVDVEVARLHLPENQVQVSNVEVQGTRARVQREAEGLRIAELLIRLDTETDEAKSPEPETAPEETQDSEPEAPAPREAQAASDLDLRVDQLLFHGLDFLVSDVTVAPPFELPIADLSLELRGLRLPLGEFPVSLRLVVDSGLVELPERTGADNLLAGVLSSVAGSVSGAEDEYRLEERALWDQFEVTGRVTPSDPPTGRVELTLLGLELPAFRGLALASGVDIGDGLVDTNARLRLRGAEGLTIDSRTELDSLSLSEPADGPLSRYLQLPAPLDTVLFLLRDERGRQKIPLNVRVGQEGLSMGAVAGAAVTVLGQLIAESLTAAPARLLSPMTDLVGLTGHAPQPLTTETLELPYHPGALALDLDQAAGISELIAEMRARPDLSIVLQHEFGSADVERAEALANPAPELARELRTRLVDRLTALRRERAHVAAETRARYAVGLDAEAQAGTQELRRIDAAMLRTDESLAALLELERPGAERRRGQRTRHTATSLAEERLERLEEELIRRGGRGLRARIDRRRPRFPGLDALRDGTLPELGRATITPRTQN